MTELKLVLNTPYTYEGDYTSDYGFVHTTKPLKAGDVFKFEDLEANSDVSDMRPEHYQHFVGKNFKVTNELKTRVFNGFVAIEV